MIRAVCNRLSVYLLVVVFGFLLLPSLTFASNWLDSDPFVLTYQKVSSTEGRIHVRFQPGTTRVLLPNGETVYSDTTFTVQKNGVYDFVAYNVKNQPQQRSITVSDLDVDDAPLFTAHGLYVKLDVDAFDTLSGVDAYRYRVEGEGWSSWKKWESTNREEVRIPTTTRTDSFHETKAIEVEVRDVAGNVRKTEGIIRVDHDYPVITPHNETIYTRTGEITIPLEVRSSFKKPDTLIVTESGKTKTYDLTKIDHTSTLLGRRPVVYLSDWEDNIKYQVEPIQGLRTLELEVIKTYKDFKGNTVQLSSGKDTRYVIRVVYDTEAPTGTIWIQSDNNEVLSRDVLIDLTFSDRTSGVKSVRVFDEEKERYLTEEQIREGKATIPWTLSRGKDAVVYMEVTDRAGNKAVFESNAVTVSNITIDDVRITRVINPAFYRNGNVNGIQPPYNMIPGGSFSFLVKYNLGYVDYSRFEVTGTYRIQIVDGNDPAKILYDSRQANGGRDIPFTQKLSDGQGFTATFPIPRYYVDSTGKEKTFDTGDLVLLSVELKREEIATGKILTTNILPSGSNIMVVGRIEPGSGKFIDSYIRFRELN